MSIHSLTPTHPRTHTPTPTCISAVKDGKMRVGWHSKKKAKTIPFAFFFFCCRWCCCRQTRSKKLCARTWLVGRAVAIEGTDESFCAQRQFFISTRVKIKRLSLVTSASAFWNKHFFRWQWKTARTQLVVFVFGVDVFVVFF